MLLIVPLPLTPAQEWTERHLVTWRSWKHGWYGPKGYADGSLVVENYSTIDRDSDAAYERLDEWIALTCEAVINGLGNQHPAQKAALYRAYDITATFRFPRDNYQAVLTQAKASVQDGLRRRGVWLGE